MARSRPRAAGADAFRRVIPRARMADILAPSLPILRGVAMFLDVPPALLGSLLVVVALLGLAWHLQRRLAEARSQRMLLEERAHTALLRDRKSTRLNSSHVKN